MDVTEGIYIPVGDQTVFVPMVGKENGKAVFKTEHFISKQEVPDVEKKMPSLNDTFRSKAV